MPASPAAVTRYLPLFLSSLSLSVVAVLAHLGGAGVSVQNYQAQAHQVVLASTSNTPVQERGDLAASDEILRDGSFYDRYTFSAEAGDFIRVYLGSTEFDSYLILLDPQGNRVSENDDLNPANRNAGLLVAANTSGIYTVYANSFTANSEGQYDIQVDVGTTSVSLLPAMAYSAVPEETASCHQAVSTLTDALQSDRELTPFVSGMALDALYAATPDGREQGIHIALRGPAALSIMFSPDLMNEVASEVVDQCDSVGAITFTAPESDYERTFGVLPGRRGQSPGDRVNEFLCVRLENTAAPLPWGRRQCL